MISSLAKRILPLFKQFRNLSGGLILDSKTVTKRKSLKTTDIKKTSRKKQKLIKKAPGDIEAVWLENLSIENLPVYRKTSYGTFRKINSKKLLKRLQEIFPTQLEGIKTAATAQCLEQTKELDPPPTVEAAAILGETKLKPESEKSEDGLPFMSDYLLSHLHEFPLLKSNAKSPACDFMLQENEDFGAVDASKFPSVTNILTETMSQASKRKLKLWRERMIAEMGAENFKKYYKDMLLEGSLFHSTLKTYLEVADKKLVKVDPVLEGCWKSLENVLSEIDDVKYVEEPIYHPILLYKGVLDCVASYRGTPCVIEWKKSSKEKLTLSDTYEAPLQLTAYLGALPWNKNITLKKGVVIVVFTDGKPAKVFEMSLESCEVYWMEWLSRLKTYWLKKSSVAVEE